MTRYLAERFPLIVFGPVALAIAFAAGAGTIEPATLARDVVIALVALAHLRLWDDLADRGADALTHPGRALVRARSTAPYVIACGLLGAAAVAMLWFADASGRAAAALLGLHALFATWYTLRGARSAAGDFLLLAKYPALVLILAGNRLAQSPVPIVVAAVLAYAAACAYEAWHDPAAFSIRGQS